MAFLKPTKLTCPACDYSAAIKLVVGVGPHSRKGDIPYQSYTEAGPFTEDFDANGEKTGTLLCPNDGTPVWTNQSGASMEGPLTEQEITSGRRLNWVPEHLRPKPRNIAKSPKDGARPE